MQEERDFHTNRTLTERVKHIEDLLVQIGIVDDRNQENSGCDKTVTGKGPLASDDYRDAQQVRNREASYRIAREEDGGVSMERATALEEITQRIGNSMSNIHRITQALQTIGNRTMGVIPTGAAQGREDDQREPDGTLECVFRMIDYLERSIEDLQQKAVRLERL